MHGIAQLQRGDRAPVPFLKTFPRLRGRLIYPFKLRREKRLGDHLHGAGKINGALLHHLLDAGMRRVSRFLAELYDIVKSIDPQGLFKQLEDVQLDSSQVFIIRDARISRGALNLYFDRGVIGFFEPVAGRITGATFKGEGEVLMIPPNPVEKRSLAQFTKSAVLEERFTSAYLRFTDATARHPLPKPRRAQPDETRAV